MMVRTERVFFCPTQDMLYVNNPPCDHPGCQSCLMNGGERYYLGYLLEDPNNKKWVFNPQTEDFICWMNELTENLSVDVWTPEIFQESMREKGYPLTSY